MQPSWMPREGVEALAVYRLPCLVKLPFPRKIGGPR
jgi:hypothetical protein